MVSPENHLLRITAAWQGRISGCLLGKPLEVLSFKQGLPGVRAYLRNASATPLRDYVPYIPGGPVPQSAAASCRQQIRRADPDDDINYTVLALAMLEQHGSKLQTEDVARTWLQLLPAGVTWTAERAAYAKLLTEMDSEFVNGAPPGFDLADCADNEFNEWIGAQIRADLYGWVCAGQAALAAELAGRDAALSHRGAGVHGAQFIAALGASLQTSDDLQRAIDAALALIPAGSDAAAAVRFARQLDAGDAAVDRLHSHFAGLSPVHTLNNLALVVWALNTANGDFSTAIGNAVAGGWDTDCNGATVGGLCGIAGMEIPPHWTRPWAGRVLTDLAGHGELALDELAQRTLGVARTLMPRAQVA